MICKNCKTAVSDTEKMCGYCGRAVNPLKKIKKAAGIATVILMAMACAVYLYLNGAGKIDFFEGDFVFAPNTEFTPTPTPRDEPNVSEPAAEGAEQIETGIFRVLEDAYLAAKAYMLNNQETSFISKMGYLYNFSEGKFVTPEDLAKQELIDYELYSEALAKEGITTDGVWFLYLDGYDFVTYREIEILPADKPELFCAAETRSGVALVSENSFGVLYRENFIELMSGYNYEYGEIVYPSARGDIINAIRSYEFYEGDYDIRYMAGDGKYSYIILSKSGISDIYYQYLLVYEDGGYSIIAAEIGQGGGYLTEIGKIAPDINFELFPRFVIDYHNLMPASYFDFIVERLIEEELIFEESPLFVSGTEDAAYLEFEEGGKFLALYLNKGLEHGEWAVRSVSDYAEAYEILSVFNTKNPPVFILRQ